MGIDYDYSGKSVNFPRLFYGKMDFMWKVHVELLQLMQIIIYIPVQPF